jgi:hypothetical protein
MVVFSPNSSSRNPFEELVTTERDSDCIASDLQKSARTLGLPL